MVMTTLIYIIGFILIHLFSKNMKFLDAVPRSRFLSVAGGISVAYVFLFLLPELGHFQRELEGELDNGGWAFIESHIYIVAMLGLAIFYGLEVMVKQSKRRTENKEKAGKGVFLVHIGSFALYNFLIGYLLVHQHDISSWGAFFYFFAMGLHFITNDKSLRSSHKKDYDKYGRWLLTAAIACGWIAGISTEVSGVVVSILVALLAGGVILNVMKEELPEERESSFLPFVIGMVSYSVLLLLI
ncbi:hypothetical protein [Planococcus sp. CAU13]|uniref:hypothetical protein n=1 Tax=Planococcus sp. CAU13 TaxID=1541197 RepID=UPI00052FF949|nr:hypothetical protein [Planococcus sp. CAU13]